MTVEQREFYDKYFTRYGSPYQSADRTLYLHFSGMDLLETPADVVNADKHAAAWIKDFENYIKFLQLYRQELAERYNHLVTDPTVEVVKLVREKRYRGNVFYHMRFYTRYIETGKEVLNRYKTFEGTQRHEAIKEFNAYVKAHPDVIGEKDIEKGRWER